MDFSRRPDTLTPLQRDLLAGFFSRERRLVLTGGAALAGFYLGHRTTEDLDLFSPPGLDLDEAERAVVAAALERGATIERLRTYPDFHRRIARRGVEQCIIDLVIDRAPRVYPHRA
jgi:predicted nucleotidyltransferase component of viral defense system